MHVQGQFLSFSRFSGSLPRPEEEKGDCDMDKKRIQLIEHYESQTP